MQKLTRIEHTGGTNVPFQEAAVPMLKPEVVLKEMQALQKHFKSKRDFVIARLREIGFKFNRIPNRYLYDTILLPPLVSPTFSLPCQRTAEEEIS
jgi:aspartate/methionine/tyrosine aminotransferase